MKNKVRVHEVVETTSTNDFLKGESHAEEADVTFVFAHRQTSGRGQGSNKWESEPGENLTFSLMFTPKGIMADEQFAISMAFSVELVKLLKPYVGKAKVKWPNDIYVGDGKIAGMLIENTLRGNEIGKCIVGIGLNVNQTVFISDAPNPVSIRQITGQEVDLEKLRSKVVRRLSKMVTDKRYLCTDELRETYLRMLYRRRGYHAYRDVDGEFMARIEGVEPDGRLILTDKQGRQRIYAFKQVEYVI